MTVQPGVGAARLYSLDFPLVNCSELNNLFLEGKTMKRSASLVNDISHK